MSYESRSFHRHLVCNHHKEGTAKMVKSLKLIDVNPLLGMIKNKNKPYKPASHGPH